ncbi:MAG: dTDP-4-dehydrorhamnose 3,5-epimerase [Bacteroidia bacterium]|nr:dTDP-4-dehydrorhamnose 3,5-epimerase [Bacteroidia bacterium]
MPFDVHPAPIPGLLLIEPKIFGDARGFFMESYSKRELAQAGIDCDFVQDNLSLSCKNTLRGLHFQAPPFAQAKLVCVLRGAAMDVVVDIRSQSPHYGKHFAVELNDAQRRILFIPEGFAHGFLALSDECLFAYKCSNYYAPASEGGLAWDDPDLNIDWRALGLEGPALVSEKDRRHPRFADFVSPF